MTSPKVPTFYRAGARWYEHPGTARTAPGVTSVLNTLPKPFLKAWAAKEVAMTAVAMGGDLVRMAQRDEAGAVDYLKRSPDRNTRAAADTGTAAHGIFEALALGQPLGRITPALEPFARHFRDFLDVVQPRFLRCEDTVWSDTHNYAGSFDGFAEIQGERCWLDNKTTRSGVHSEVALQLSAYGHADYLLDGKSGEQLLLPKASRGVVLHVRPEGWALYEVPIGDDVFSYFVSLRQVFDWVAHHSKSVVGRPAVKGAAA